MAGGKVISTMALY